MKSDYFIPVISLKLGKHAFDFSLSDSFFSSLGIPPASLLVKKGELTVSLVLDKQQEDIFLLHFQIEGTLTLTCERCLDAYDHPVATHETQWVKTGQTDFDDPDMLVMAKNEFQLDLAPILYEFICLSLPLIQRHRLDANGQPSCTNETAEQINRLQSLDINEQWDPRWEALKKIDTIE